MSSLFDPNLLESDYRRFCQTIEIKRCHTKWMQVMETCQTCLFFLVVQPSITLTNANKLDKFDATCQTYSGNVCPWFMPFVAFMAWHFSVKPVTPPVARRDLLFDQSQTGQTIQTWSMNREHKAPQKVRVKSRTSHCHHLPKRSLCRGPSESNTKIYGHRYLPEQVWL